jgi:hypothetical protein
MVLAGFTLFFARLRGRMDLGEPTPDNTKSDVLPVADHSVESFPSSAVPSTDTQPEKARRRFQWMPGGDPDLESSLVRPLLVGGALAALGWSVWQIGLPPQHGYSVAEWQVNRISIAASALAAFAVAVLAAAALVHLGTVVYTSIVVRFGDEDVAEALWWLMPVAVALGIGLGLLIWQ